MNNIQFIFLVSLFFIAGTESNARDAINFQQIGSFVSYQEIPHGMMIKATHGKVSITAYTRDVIRIRAVQDHFAPDFSYAVIRKPEASFETITNEKDQLILQTPAVIIQIQKDPLRIRFRDLTGNILNEDYKGFGITWLGTEVSCHKKLFPDEKFIGLGEKTGHLNRRGSAYTNWNTDAPGYRMNQDPLYETIPFYIGIHGQSVYGIFFDNTYRTNFNFGASNDLFSSFSAVDGEMNYYFFAASTVRKIIEDYTWLTGRVKLPPLWSLGYQQSRWGYYPESEFADMAHNFRTRKIPCDVLYLDIDYMDHYKIFTWNKKRFPHPAKMISELAKEGFHTTVIVDPGIKVEKGYPAYEEGVKKGYFVRYPDSTYWSAQVWPGWCHFPDFTNPATRLWWGRKFAGYVSDGITGFWNDMNEPSSWGQDNPDIVEFDFDGHQGTMRKAHNVYGLEMARSTYEGTRQLMNGKRPFVLTRAAYSGVQRYSAVWTGDNVASDEHMLLTSRLVTSLGISGVPFAGADVGGFIGEPGQKLITKWTALGVVTPFFRNHTAVDTKAQEPWAFGESTERALRRIITQRYRLMPYIYSSFYKTSRTGIPVARSLSIDYTFDNHVYDPAFEDEYLFGPQLLVAPSSSQQDFVRVYLPRGRWYQLNTTFDNVRAMYKGQQEVITASPADEITVFARAGAIIPMQKAGQYTGDMVSDTLNIHVYYGTEDHQFLYYEDDGTTYRYTKGSFFKRLIRFQPQDHALIFDQAKGSYLSKFKIIRLHLHHFPPLKQIRLNNHTLQKINSRTLMFPNESKEIKITWKETGK